MKGEPTVLLLASGLSVLKPNSFSRQFRLLKRNLEQPGVRIILAGAGPEQGSIGGDMFDVPEFSTETVGDLARRFGISGIILLGYPDQFPFLPGEQETPVYFWFQCSRPVIAPGLESCAVVPLTPMTAVHLERAGLQSVGPVIPHGVDTQVFQPDARRRSRRKGPLIIAVGANSRRKRFDKLLAAFELVAGELPGARLRIKTDAADKPGGFDLVKLAELHGVAGRVSIVCGELPETELASFFASSDIYVHTAEWEGFCIPVIEAMACGVPVVTHPVQGPGETIPYPELLVGGSEKIADGDVELLMADPAAFAGATVRFATDRELAAYASNAGRVAATEFYDIRKVAGMWSELLGI